MNQHPNIPCEPTDEMLADAAAFDKSRNPSVEYRWVSEGDGFTLYRVGVNLAGQAGLFGRNCGRLNTDATDSTHRLAMLYNAADALRKALQNAYNGHKRVMHTGKPCSCPFWDEARAALALCEKGTP